MLALAISTSTAAANGTKNELILENDKLSYSFNPVIMDGVEMAPARTVFSMIGVEVTWNSSTRSVIGNGNGISFKLQAGSMKAAVNGYNIELAAAPFLLNGTTYVPLDFVMEASNQMIAWDSAKKSVSVNIGKAFKGAETGQASATAKPETIRFSHSSRNLTGNLILVNKQNTLPKNYTPAGLTSIMDKNKKYIIPARTSDITIKNEVLEAASAMFKAAEDAGLKGLVVSNSYRSYDLQNFFYTKKLNQYLKQYKREEAVRKAAMIVAPPGQSEHQTGLAIDITTRSLLKTGDYLVEAFAKTPEGKWIYSDAWKYGFVVRYQTDKTKITGIISEPWHIRYVGAPHAEIMFKNKMCLEEYLEYIKSKSYIKYKDFKGQTYEIYHVNAPFPVDALTVMIDAGQKKDISMYGKSGVIVTKSIGK